MYKKKQFSKLEKKYNKYQDEGTVGFMMKLCHQNLEKDLNINDFNNNSKILEIGAGSSPHLSYLSHAFAKYHFLENSKFSIGFLKKKFSKNNNIEFKYYDSKKIPYKKNHFDRVIISHVLEHVPEPELFLKKIMYILKKNGTLSIALPNDPGLFWRLGRSFLKMFAVKKKLNISNLEYDYMIASEHINSIFNLVSIIKYKYKKNIVSEHYLPFKIKFLDFNLFYNITLKK